MADVFKALADPNRRKLLDRRGVGLREDDLELQVGGVEVAVLLADVERPEIGRGGIDGTDQDGVGGTGRRPAQGCQAKAQSHGKE